MSDYVKLTLAATALACTDAGTTDRLASDEQWNVLLGTTHGSAAYSGAYYRQIVQEGSPPPIRCSLPKASPIPRRRT